MWSEFVSAEMLDQRVWPRAAAVAERLWSTADVDDVGDMYRRLDATSRRLELEGLEHRSGPRRMLARLAHDRPLPPLEAFGHLPEAFRIVQVADQAGVDFVKTSTGFAPSGATHDDLRLMRANTSPHVQVKAAGGVRTLDALLDVMNLGVTRIGATATEAMILDFRARKAGLAPATTATAETGGY